MGNDVLFNGASTAGTRIGRTEEAYRAAERQRAVRALAGNHARNAEDLALLLDMLDLTPQEGLTKGTT